MNEIKHSLINKNNEINQSVNSCCYFDIYCDELCYYICSGFCYCLLGGISI